MFKRILLKLTHALTHTIGRYCYGPNWIGVESFPPGHFYSPLPDLDIFEAELQRHQILSQNAWTKVGVCLETHERTHLRWLSLLSNQDRIGLGRYILDNPYFHFADAFTTTAMLVENSPSQIIEIGSGFSSAAMLDAAQSRDLATKFTFIDPDMTRIEHLLTDHDFSLHQVKQSRVQDIPIATFKMLRPNDILFIDSSHVLKVFSDLEYLLIHVLPELAPGVIVHFHDIFYPTAYPSDWLAMGRAWNESLAIQMLLTNSPSFELIFFNSFFYYEAPKEHRALNPRFFTGIPASLWLRKR